MLSCQDRPSFSNHQKTDKALIPRPYKLKCRPVKWCGHICLAAEVSPPPTGTRELECLANEIDLSLLECFGLVHARFQVGIEFQHERCGGCIINIPAGGYDGASARKLERKMARTSGLFTEPSGGALSMVCLVIAGLSPASRNNVPKALFSPE